MNGQLLSLVLTVVWCCCPLPCVSVAVDQLYSYGAAAGDSTLPEADSGTSEKILLQVPFVWFGSNKTSIYVRMHDVTHDNHVYSGTF